MKKNYQKPMCEPVSLETTMTILDMSMTIYNHDPRIIDDCIITDGSEILAPKINLWEDEECEK